MGSFKIIKWPTLPIIQFPFTEAAKVTNFSCII